MRTLLPILLPILISTGTLLHVLRTYSEEKTRPPRMVLMSNLRRIRRMLDQGKSEEAKEILAETEALAERL